jgi:hypothetical protein
MIWQIVADVSEVFVDGLFVVLLYFHGLFVDHIYSSNISFSTLQTLSMSTQSFRHRIFEEEGQ